MSDCTLAVKGDKCKHAKRPKKHLTTLLCYNMDASDKLFSSLIIAPFPHPAIDILRGIELVFLPKNTIIVLQPLDQGIIQKVKVKFHEMAMNGIVVSWRVVRPEVINNCFRHIHFSPPVNKEDAANAEGPESIAS
ncbi:hypothetical protein PR048_015614 [Dryococelus australis]|uniref:DDE-1 domain-containing protein n=1 Tax=Dryococelus australis TaxID=614101 RepID=A0ABQ9HHL4_9NEOP|nr:hypothetical protein PR048_015614 [Dryococelus australis]